MKKFISLLLYLLLVNSTSAIAMENSMTYQRATTEHIANIVDLINNHAIEDNDKIVILPEKFRQSAIKENILHKKLYCATTQTNEVIAFKKLYIINDKKEYENIIYNEIRCSGNKSEFVKSVAFTPNNTTENLLFDTTIPFSFENSIVIYNGNDYTEKSHRGKKINSFLMNYAFNSQENDIKQAISDKNLSYIILLYGLTHFNAGENNGIDRTPSIVNAFRTFINEVSPGTVNNNIIHKSYHAHMPTFAPDSEECIPLPDDKSISGYGNVLIFPLVKNT